MYVRISMMSEITIFVFTRSDGAVRDKHNWCCLHEQRAHVGCGQLISGVHRTLSMMYSDDLWDATENYTLMREAVPTNATQAYLP